MVANVKIMYLLTKWEGQMGKYFARGVYGPSAARSLRHDREPNISHPV